jgi:hypothetical protein
MVQMVECLLDEMKASQEQMEAIREEMKTNQDEMKLRIQANQESMWTIQEGVEAKK